MWRGMQTLWGWIGIGSGACFHRNQKARLRHYQRQHGKRFAAALRDIINAGLTAAGVPRADELERHQVN